MDRCWKGVGRGDAESRHQINAYLRVGEGKELTLEKDIPEYPT